MSKIILKSGIEYQINSASPMLNNQLAISFKSVPSFDDLISHLTVDALDTFKIYPINDISFDVYDDYTKIVSPSSVTTLNDGTCDILITLEKEDEVSQRLRRIEQSIGNLNSVVDWMLVNIIAYLPMEP